MKKYIIISIMSIILICGSFFSGKCTYGASQLNTGFYDNSSVTLRLPDKRGLDIIRKDKDFQYEKEIVPGNTIADIIAGWISWLRKNYFSHIFSREAESFWRIFPYVVIAASVIIVMLALRRGGFFGIFSRKSYRTGDVRDDPDEDIHGIDFDSMIRKFVDTKDYRMAFRYRFLKTLKQLSIDGVIVWKKEKTNRDYVNDMLPENRRSSFNELVNIFEYVWYGSFTIDKNFLELMNERFRLFDLTTGDSLE